MVNDILGNIVDVLKSTAPISTISNAIAGVILLIVGLILLSKKQKRSKGRVIGGRICIVISILALLGAASNWIFSSMI